MSRKRAKLPGAEALLGHNLKSQNTKVLKSQEVKTVKVQSTVYFSPETLKEMEVAKARLFAEHNLKVTKSEIVEASVRKAISNIDSLVEVLGEYSPP